MTNKPDEENELNFSVNYAQFCECLVRVGSTMYPKISSVAKRFTYFIESDLIPWEKRKSLLSDILDKTSIADPNLDSLGIA